MPSNNQSDEEMDNKEKIVVPSESAKNLDPTKPIDYWLFILIGIGICFLNMRFNQFLYTHADEMVQIFSYLIIIFVAMVPGIGIGIWKRPRGYAYLWGYIIGGILEGIIGDLYIGLYTAFVSLMLFLIPYMVFNRWKSVSKVKLTSD